MTMPGKSVFRLERRLALVALKRSHIAVHDLMRTKRANRFKRRRALVTRKRSLVSVRAHVHF